MQQNEQSIIETKNLCKSFGEVHALQNVDLKVPEHAIFGFLGPNGAGKTTLMKTLLGLARPSSGSATIFGFDIVSQSIAIRERIGYLPQHPRFIEKMTARENVEFAAKFFFRGPASKIRERCDEMLDLVGLADKADRPVYGFSGGEKQRLGIALAQVNYPDLLILDEPASALDPMGRLSVLEIMERIRKYSTIFYSTHILDDVQRVSDTVAILNKGRLVVSGPVEQLINGKDGIVYSLCIKGKTAQLDQQMVNIPWVTQTEQIYRNGISQWHISVNNEGAAEKDLLRLVMSDPTVIVTEFTRKQYELEEIFMDIVRGDENDC